METGEPSHNDLGYSETFAGGSSGVINPVVGPGVLSLDPLEPNGTLAFNYVQPFASIQFNIYKGLSYKTHVELLRIQLQSTDEYQHPHHRRDLRA